jgi:hypothetical protein
MITSEFQRSLYEALEDDAAQAWSEYLNTADMLARYQASKRYEELAARRDAVRECMRFEVRCREYTTSERFTYDGAWERIRQIEDTDMCHLDHEVIPA